jgi:transposase
MTWIMPEIEDQRQQFVIRATSGVERITQLCESFKISRTTGYHWLNRYKTCRILRDLIEKDRRPFRSPNKTATAVEERVLELGDSFGWKPKRISEFLERENIRVSPRTVTRIIKRVPHNKAGDQHAITWMIRMLVADDPVAMLEHELPGIHEAHILAGFILRGSPRERKKAMAVIASSKGVPVKIIADCLQISPRALTRYLGLYGRGGTAVLYPRRKRRCTDNDFEKRTLFSLLHSPPLLYSINRTSWRMDDLHSVLRQAGHRISRDRIRRIIKTTGFRWRKAKTVLTSNDPQYDAKVNSIKAILSKLLEDEAFFSIDEFGPFAVKQKGGLKRVGPRENYVIPQRQTSKGWLIITAALELSRNQVTHFYSLKKNTDEMIKMADLLRHRYRKCSKIYLSWDAASWHISKKLYSHLDNVNRRAREDRLPIVKTAPLPSGAQFQMSSNLSSAEWREP